MENNNSYRFGAGRYIQEEQALETIGEEILRLGKSALLIAGPTARSVCSERIEAALQQSDVAWKWEIYKGQCSYNSVEKFRKLVLEKCFEVVVGIGGGRIMDLCKGIANVTKRPLVLVPTSSATCACYTALSVMYTDAGESVGPWHYEQEVNCVLVDETVMANQPPRLFAAGILDAMAKYVEIPSGVANITLGDGIAKYSAYLGAEHIYKVLKECGLKAYHDVEQGILSKEVKTVVYVNLALTGYVSALMRGVGQTALAHNLGAATHTLYPMEAERLLHGELVATGMLMQLRYNRNMEEIPKLKNYMKSMHMPVSIQEFGLPQPEEAIPKITEYISASQFVPHTEESLEKLRDAIKEISK